jgi:hypothetical protein
VLPPVTVDAKVCTVPAITVAVGGDTVSTIVLGLELLHPFCKMAAPESNRIAAVLILRNFMTDISLTLLCAGKHPRPTPANALFCSPFILLG